MSEPDLKALVSSFIATARAHHEATGGINPGWADWYAERLVADVNQITGSELSPGELSDWLRDADRRFREDEPDVSWPKAYAAWFIDEIHNG